MKEKCGSFTFELPSRTSSALRLLMYIDVAVYDADQRVVQVLHG
jgi:hypothetical protein